MTLADILTARRWREQDHSTVYDRVYCWCGWSDRCRSGRVEQQHAHRWQQGMSSPDRMDAAVNAYERLMELIGGESVIASPYSTPPPQPAGNGVPAPAPTTTPSLAALLSSPMNATNNA